MLNDHATRMLDLFSIVSYPDSLVESVDQQEEPMVLFLQRNVEILFLFLLAHIKVVSQMYPCIMKSLFTKVILQSCSTDVTVLWMKVNSSYEGKNHLTIQGLILSQCRPILRPNSELYSLIIFVLTRERLSQLFRSKRFYSKDVCF